MWIIPIWLSKMAEGQSCQTQGGILLVGQPGHCKMPYHILEMKEEEGEQVGALI